MVTDTVIGVSRMVISALSVDVFVSAHRVPVAETELSTAPWVPVL
ncbi:hypothetical protein [Rarobacter faecitabidus]